MTKGHALFETPRLPVALGNHIGDFSDENSAAYQTAISFALQNGVQVLDTAINYRGMRSEKDIGIVLKELFSSGALSRGGVMVCSKAGLLYGDITKGLRPADYLEKILPESGVIPADFHEYQDSCQCLRQTLHPAFYKEAIATSRENLGLETIDVHYVHMPDPVTISGFCSFRSITTPPAEACSTPFRR